MQIPIAHLRKLLAGIGFITVATFAQAQMTGPNSMRDATKMPAIPEGKESDIKQYGVNGGGVVIGREALEQMPKSDLVLWLAGNQFFAMDDVIGAFLWVSSLCRPGCCYKPSRPVVGFTRASNIAGNRIFMPPSISSISSSLR